MIASPRLHDINFSGRADDGSGPPLWTRSAIHRRQLVDGRRFFERR